MQSVRMKLRQCTMRSTLALAALLACSLRLASAGPPTSCPLGEIAALGRCAPCFDGWVKSPQDNSSIGAVCVDAQACGSSAYGSDGMCHACPTGQVILAFPKTEPIAEDCGFCPSGRVRDATPADILDAKCLDGSLCGPSGYALNGTCFACDMGKVIPGFPKAEQAWADCQPCPEGTIKFPTPAFTLNATCTDAADACGTSGYAVNGTCRACPLGTVIAGYPRPNPTLADCQPCSDGTIKAPNTATALAAVCAAGSACGPSGFAVNGTCRPCPVGQVISDYPLLRQTEADCAFCAEGLVKSPDSSATLNAICIDASACGSSGYAVNGSCRACPVGQVLTSAPALGASGSNETSSSLGTIPCGPCEAGLVKNPNTAVDLNAKCVAPPACGSSAYLSGGSCKPCPTGMVIKGFPLYNQSASDCQPCDPGKVKFPNTNYDLNAKCVDGSTCGPSGYASSGSCKACPQGKVIKGYPLTVQTAADCQACADGTVKYPDTNYDFSAVCVDGSVCGMSAYAQAGSCKACGQGKIILAYPLAVQTAADCQACPSGLVKFPDTNYDYNARCVNGSNCGSSAYAHNGSCKACPQGKVILGYPLANQTLADCQPCALGMAKLPDTNYDYNAQCVNGSVCGSSAYPVNGSCKACTQGKVISGYPNSNQTAADCQFCGTGLVKWPDTNYDLNAMCIPGVVCGASAYAFNGSCKACPQGKVIRGWPSNNQTTAADCHFCPNGLAKWPDTNYDMNATCIDGSACGSSAYAVNGSCKACPTGRVVLNYPLANQTSADCLMCRPGQVKIPDTNYDFNAICTGGSACGSSSYAVNGSCKACPRGTVILGYPDLENVTSADCVPCPNGQVKSPDTNYHLDAVCVEGSNCGSSGYAVNGSCKACPTGEVVLGFPKANQTVDDCQPCPEGTSKSPNTNYHTDAVCVGGGAGCGSSAYAAAGSCKACPRGMVIKGFPLEVQTLADCAPCPSGQVKSPDTDYNSDAVCTDGSECGSSAYVVNGSCRACPRGMVILGYPLANQTEADCQPCPDGQVKAPDNDYSYDSKCVEGLECGPSSYAVNGSCRACPRGMVIKGYPKTLQTIDDCQPCDEGTVKSPDNDYSLDAVCVEGQNCGPSGYAVNGSCAACPNGQVIDGFPKAVQTAADCKACPDGQVKSPDNNYALDAVCIDGSECGSSGYGANGSCAACPWGTVVLSYPQSSQVVADCQPCPTGTAKVPDTDYNLDSVCQEGSVCGPSAYAEDGHCKACPRGTAISGYPLAVQTAADCQPCDSGKVKSPDTDYNLDATCVDGSECGPSAYAENGSCKACPRGMVILGYPLAVQTQADCQPCPSGQVKSSDTDYNNDAVCVSGSDCGPSGYADLGSCKACPKGQVIMGYPLEAQTLASCAFCPDGSVKSPDTDYNQDAVCVDGSECGSAAYALLGSCRGCPTGLVISGYPKASQTLADCQACPPGTAKEPFGDWAWDAKCVTADEPPEGSS